MASTYTDGLAVEIIGSGDKAGSWGGVTNNNLKALEEGISRYAEVAIGASNTSTLNIPDGQAAYTDDSEGRSAVIKWTGASGGSDHTVSLTVGGAPSTQANFVAVNGLSNSRSLIIDSSGTSLTIPNGYSASVHIDDSNNIINSLASLSIDKLALGNQEVISNTVDDRVDILTSTLQIGNGSGVAVLESDGTGSVNRDLLLRTSSAAASGTIRFNDVANGPIEVTPGGTGSVVISKADINAGAIDGTIIGAAAAAAGTFTTVGTSSNGAITANGSGAISSGTGAITTGGAISTTGSGSMTSAGLLTATGGVSTTAINSASAITVSTTAGNNNINLTPDGTGEVNITKVDIDSGSISGTTITNSSVGSSSPSTGAFTTLSATGTSTLVAVNASGNIATTGSGTITSAGKLTVSSGGIDLVGGALDLNNGGITNAGAISGASYTDGTFPGGVTSPSVTSTGNFTLGTASNGNVTVDPNGTGRIILESDHSTTSTNGAIHLESSAGGITLETTSNTQANAHIIFLTDKSSGSPGVQCMVTQWGFAIGVTGGQYLNYGSTLGSGGYGGRGTSNTFNISNTNADGWGQPYHTGAVHGQGVYYEATSPVASGEVYTLTTGFSSVPSIVTAYLECLTIDAGYAVGDHVLVTSTSVTDTFSTGFSLSFDGTSGSDLHLSIGSAGLWLLNKTSGAETNLTESRWRMRIKAWK